MANAGKGMGHDNVRGVQHVGDTPVDEMLGEGDIAGQRQGNNQLHGDDQARVHNQRHSVPGERVEKPDTDEFIERHKTGLRSAKLAPSEKELDKELRRP